MTNKADKQTTKAMIIFVAVLIVIGLSEFLFRRDNSYSYTGWQILAREGWNFWVWAILLTAIAGVAIYYISKKVMASGGVGVKLSILIPVVVLFSIAFGKGCTDKANDGVTTEKGRPEQMPKDTTRVPAEELLPK